MSSLISSAPHSILFFFFFFNDTATTEIYTLSLHDALPIWPGAHHARRADAPPFALGAGRRHEENRRDRKSTRLNSSHSQISYAVFCLKKKKTKTCLTVYRCSVPLLHKLLHRCANIVVYYHC